MKADTIKENNPIYEAMICVTNLHHRVRVWWKTYELRVPTQVERDNITFKINEAYSYYRDSHTDEPLLMAMIASSIGKMEYCNAVEVTSTLTGEGLLFYPDWP